MKTLTKAAAQLVAATVLSLALPLVAQAGGDHAKMGMAASPGMTDGEIRKIDKENGKITIKHGEIKHMDMPPMSMVFNVKDKAMLDKVQVGEKIQFIVIQEAGKMVVTDIQAGK
ncbi:MAG: copper-binding protein [Hydrogenophaga sp.]|jgi:Cu/Ag efflux protein CusF|nr:copper-binding protein [Hydrogenophaga sp.]